VQGIVQIRIKVPIKIYPAPFQPSINAPIQMIPILRKSNPTKLKIKYLSYLVLIKSIKAITNRNTTPKII